jgi:UrcA family protein
MVNGPQPEAVMTRALLILAAGTGIALALPAQAQGWDRGDLRQTGVPIADLDLSNPAGIDTLNRRIERAVGRICGDDSRCRDQAWDSTWDQVDRAIARDRRTTRLAAEREAELRACGWRGCGTVRVEEDDAPPPPRYDPPPPREPAYYAPQPRLPAYVPRSTTTVVTVTSGGPAPQVQVYSTPR